MGYCYKVVMERCEKHKEDGDSSFSSLESNIDVGDSNVMPIAANPGVYSHTPFLSTLSYENR